MIVKYKVPKQEEQRYNQLEYLYCEVIQKISIVGEKKNCIYLVKILNFNNEHTIFTSKQVQKLSFIEWLKLKIK